MAGQPLGQLISEHKVRGTAIMARWLYTLIMVLMGVATLLAYLTTGDIAVGAPRTIYLAVTAVFWLAAIIYTLQTLRLTGSSYRIYEHGIERHKGGQAQTWLYTDFNSILATVTIYRLMNILPIPLWRSYCYMLIGKDRQSTFAISPDYTDMQAMGEYLTRKLPQFSYGA